MTEQERDLDSLAKVKDALVAHLGCYYAPVLERLVARIPDTPASAPTPKRDEAGLRGAAEFAEFQLGQALSTICNGNGDPVPNLQDVRARLRTALKKITEDRTDG